MMWEFVPTAPAPLSIEPVTAFVEVNVRVELCPAVMLVGAAANVAVGAGVPPPPPECDELQPVKIKIMRARRIPQKFARCRVISLPRKWSILPL
jgi:hypothetical protein